MIIRLTHKSTEQPDTMRRSGSVAQGEGDRTLDEEIAQLKREVTKLKAERDILKKAAAYFAKEST